jgi:hypothetical protein
LETLQSKCLVHGFTWDLLKDIPTPKCNMNKHDKKEFESHDCSINNNTSKIQCSCVHCISEYYPWKCKLMFQIPEHKHVHQIIHIEPTQTWQKITLQEHICDNFCIWKVSTSL